MARPKGSRNKSTIEKEAATAGAPAAPAAPRSAGIGDNSGLNDEQRQALSYHHKDQYITSLANKKKYAAEHLNVCKRITAELGDGAVEDIKNLISLETPEGEAKLKAQVDRIMRVARWQGLPLGTQADLLDGIDRTPLNERAKAEGKRAGMAGARCEPPHAGQEAANAWIEGWHEGQAVMVSNGIKPLAGAPAGSTEPDFGEVLEDAPKLKGAAAFRENVEAGDQHIRDTAAELAGQKETTH